MHVTIKLTPQRVMVLFLAIAVWYCLISIHEVDRVDRTDDDSEYSFTLFSPSDAREIRSSDTMSTKRTLINSSSSTTKSNTSNSTSNSHNYTLPRRTRHGHPPIPSVIGIGPEKCGTTSLANMLTLHPRSIPEIIKPLHEPTGIDYEMRVFLPCGNRNYTDALRNVLREGYPSRPENFCSLGWYQHFWAPQHDDIRYLRNDTAAWQWRYYYYFEKSPAYWCYPHVAYIFHRMLVPQGTKFLAELRDPIKRTFSYWSHQSQLGHVQGSFASYITAALNDAALQTMLGLLRDERKGILEISTQLIEHWEAYVYSAQRPYGYIGERTASAKRSGRRPLTWTDNEEDGDEDDDDVEHKIERVWRDVEETQLRGRQWSRQNQNQNRKLLWRPTDPGFVSADTNPTLGVAASCYVVPLLMWLQYIPVHLMGVIQSELMYGGNHNPFITDVRCWMAVPYEYETLQACQMDGGRKVEIEEEHTVHSARSQINDSDKQKLHTELYQWCNQRLKELLEIPQYRHVLINEMKWNLWHS